ncbi:MAG: sulfatase-like hydrolase/transferase [Pirellulaceae bacterium]
MDRFIPSIVLLFLVAAAASGQEANSTRPNIVVVLADDLGYGDLACFGAKDVQTPHLDRLAKEGLRLTACYSGHGNCSPSRAALMTGRTPTRVGIRNWIPHGSTVHLRESEITVATLLKQAGYSTCHAGKWHLTGQFNEPAQPQAGDHGFDHWFGTQNNALPNHRNPENFVRNGREVGKTEGYAAHVVADEAIQWLQSGRDKAKPFFLYVCFHEPHEPIASDEKYTRLYPHDDPAYSAHHGNITQMDDAFGRLMKQLDTSGLAETTLVFFTSDNGPAITRQHPYGSTGGLRDKKGYLTEGGIRVPGIVRWPGKIASGSTSDEPVCGVDLLPTACEIAGIQPPQDRQLDGASMLPVFSGGDLLGGKVARTKPLYWHFNGAAGDYQLAMRVGDWKILAALDKVPARSNNITAAGQREFKAAEPIRFALYNLRDDRAESKDLSAAEPAKLAELKTLLVKSYHDVRDESPLWPVWTFDGREGARIVWPDYVQPRRGGKAKGRGKK